MINRKVICFCALSLALASGCGVRGRPQPPLEPPEIGRGKPSFTRSSRDLAIPNVPSPQASPAPVQNYEEGY